MTEPDPAKRWTQCQDQRDRSSAPRGRPHCRAIQALNGVWCRARYPRCGMSRSKTVRQAAGPSVRCEAVARLASACEMPRYCALPPQAVAEQIERSLWGLLAARVTLTNSSFRQRVGWEALQESPRRCEAPTHVERMPLAGRRPCIPVRKALRARFRAGGTARRR